jgi:DNA-binding MarR family transcriptional regulator
MRAERHNNRVSPLGLSVLIRLHRNPCLTPRALAEAENAAPQTLTRVLATLEKNGLISRVPDPSDGRQALLDLTVAGRKVLKRDSAYPEAWLAERMEHRLVPAEQEILRIATMLLQRLADEPDERGSPAGGPWLRAEAGAVGMPSARRVRPPKRSA